MKLSAMNAARVIPNYVLYGDKALPGWSDSFFCEPIPWRAAHHQWLIEPHVHATFVQVLYFRRGSARYTAAGVEHFAQSPCLVIVPSQIVHAFHYSADIDGPCITASQRVVESVAKVLMPDLIGLLRAPSVIPLTPSRHSEAVGDLFEAIQRESQTHATGQVAAGMSLIVALLVQISRVTQLAPIADSMARSRKAVKVERFRAMVDERFRTHVPLDDYASELGITAGQLSRICVEVLGVSALQVINARIVHEAQRDLIYTSSSIKQLSNALGFRDEAYFGRFFRKHTGMSTTEFRERR